MIHTPSIPSSSLSCQPSSTKTCGLGAVWLRPAAGGVLPVPGVAIAQGVRYCDLD